VLQQVTSWIRARWRPVRAWARRPGQARRSRAAPQRDRAPARPRRV